MVSLASMLSHTAPVPGLFQAALRSPNLPPGLSRKQTNPTGLNISSAGNAHSFAEQLIVERISVRITMTSITQVTPAQEVPSQLDLSPEATAQRIFSFSISLSAVYQSQNPDESAESALAGFEQLVRDAIDEGFGEARSVLDEFGRLDEQTAEFVDKTYSILDRLLDEFFENAVDGEIGENQPADAAAESSLSTLEFEYRYLHFEAASITQSSADGAETFSAEFIQIHAESLSIAFSQSELPAGSNIALIA